jgi:predicted amidohydrolase YtcJ
VDYNRSAVRAAIAVFLAMAAFAQLPENSADLIFYHGKVWTVDSARPLAQAIAIKGASIVKAGSDSEVTALRGPSTRFVDLHGRLVLPGFNDVHTHFENAVQWFFEVRLIDVTDQAELLKRLKKAAARVPPGMCGY